MNRLLVFCSLFLMLSKAVLAQNGGSAFNFDGNGGYVQIDDANQLRGSFNRSKTVEAWVNVPNLLKDRPVVQKWKDKKDKEWGLMIDGSGQNEISVTIENNGTNFEYAAGGGIIVPNRWFHIAMVYDGNDQTVHIFIDGQEYGNGPVVPGGMPSTNAPVLIGRHAYSLEKRYLGEMDEIRVWNTTKTASELLDAMNTPLTGNESGLVAYWSFDEGGGSSVIDYANNHDGNIIPTNGFPQYINSTAPLFNGSFMHLISPGGGETFMVDNTITIRWNSSGAGSNVKLEFSDNNGSNWSNITSSTSNDGAFDWTLPSDSTSFALVRITDTGNNNLTDVSEFAFRIEKPAQQLPPGGGEKCVPTNVGFRDFYYGSTELNEKPTEDKPESKLWYHDGSWWGVLWAPLSSKFRIYKLDVATQCWSEVGPDVDARPYSAQDVLWDGQKLYVASRAKTNTSPKEGRLYRYSYDAGSQSYSLDAGFPVNMNLEEKVESLVIDKDSSGQLWATWTFGAKVWINRTLGDDQTWGQPFILPVMGNDPDPDDISALLAFDGNKIGVMWSNQNEQRTYFAVHPDGNGDTNWQSRETALNGNGTNISDDHINLASSPGGEVVAAIKTNLNDLDDPGILLLKRTSGGNWSSHEVSTVRDRLTRPMVVVDSATDSVYVYASHFFAPRSIDLKVAHLDNPNFPSGAGRVFIYSDDDEDTNDAKSTKQNVNSNTGVVVIASANASEYYLHNYDALNGGGNFSPVANDDQATTTENTVVTIDILDNDFDLDGSLDPGSINVTDQPSNGGLSIDSGSGAAFYTPNTSFNGTDTFNYTVEDNSGQTSNEAVVTVSVTTAGNTPPVAADDQATTDENSAVIIDILSNDSDPDGSLIPSTVNITTSPSNGSTSVNNSNGVTTYTPNSGFSGTDTFNYTVSDDGGAPSNIATVAITVNATGGGGGQTLTFLPSDDGQVKLTEPSNNYGDKSTAKVEESKFESYFKFTASGVSGPVQNAKLRFYVTDGSSDGSDDGGSLYLVDNTFSGSSTPWNEGSLNAGNAPLINGSPIGNAGAVTPNQLVEFNVTLAVTGNGTYSFALAGSSGNQAKYYTSEGANPPQLLVTTGGTGTNDPPTAINDGASTASGVAVAIDILANDFDSDGTLDPGSVSVTSQPGDGSLSISNSNGVATYTPNAGFSGTDSFSYTVDDDEAATSNIASVTITVAAGNSPPVAVDDAAITNEGSAVVIDILNNDSDSDGTLIPGSVNFTALPSNGSISVNSVTGVTTYTPAAGFSGTDSFAYTVEDNDGATSNTATVTVTVNASGGGGTLTFLPTDDGQVKITEPGNNYGSKSTTKVEQNKFESYFKFTVSGLSGSVQNAKLRLQITDGSTDGSDDGGSLYEVDNNFAGTSTPWNEGSLNAGNAPQINGSPLGSAGTVSTNEVIEFNVSSTVSGNGTFSFALRSSSGNQAKYFTREGANPPQLIITQGSGGANDPPTAVDDVASTGVEQPVSIDILANDFDSDGTLDPGSIVIIGFPDDGSVSINSSTGVATYTPVSGFTGTDSLAYTVDDDEGATSNVAKARITVTSGNAPPVAADDQATTAENNSVVIDILNNDSDSDGTLIPGTVNYVTLPADGSVSLNSGNGVTTYTPDAGFSGTDFFTYTVEDNDGAASNIATVTVTVNASGGGGQALSFLPSDDGQVKVTEPGSNYGGKSTTKVESGKFNSYFKFVVSGLSGSVQNAKLRLKVTDGEFDGSDDGGSVYSVSNSFEGTNSPWDEGSLTSGNAPEISGSPLSTLAGVSPNETVELDVTQAVSGNGVLSFAMRSGSGNQAKYFTREGASPPQLIISTGSGGGGGNQAPVAANDAGTTAKNTNLVIDILANDSDPDGTLDATTVLLVSSPANGSVAFNPFSGIATYTPDQDFEGTDSFDYTVDDDEGATSNAATATITVLAGGSNTTLTFNPTDDGQVKITEPSSNYGSKTTMKVEASKFVAYMKFIVSGVSGSVQSALLRLQVTDGSTDGSDDGGSVYVVGNDFSGTNTPWAEASLTAGNAPAITGSPLSAAGSVTTNSTVDFDVSSVIAGDGVYSFAIASNSSNRAKYYAREGQTPPELVIDVEFPSEAVQEDEETLAKTDFEKSQPVILPEELSLSPNYPNPFNAETQISYALPEASKVQFKIYNLLGQEVRVLVDEFQEPGFRKVFWDGKDKGGNLVASGTYFGQLVVGSQRLIRRLTLQK